MAKLFGYKEPHYNFIGRKKLWYIIALIAIVPGLIVLLFTGMNLGIDFTGGSILIVQYEEEVAISEVRETVSEFVAQTPYVNKSGDNGFQIKTEELSGDTNDALVEKLGALGAMTVVRNQVIGPVIGSELLANARWALIIAAALILLYVTVRFRFNYALTAVIALIHDALVMVSIFAIFRIEVDSSFIAAVLTIIGYSINNTIVIFDRIRENESYMGRKDRKALINASINQTLSRTINTIVAVLILLLCLLFFGGETTKNFMLALTIGIIAGFFSSVFLVGCMFDDFSSHLSVKLGGDKKVAGAPAQKRTVPVKR